MIRKIIVLIVVLFTAAIVSGVGLGAETSHKSKFTMMPAVVQEVPRRDGSGVMRAVVHVEAVNDTAEINVPANARKGDEIGVWVEKSTKKINSYQVLTAGAGHIIVISVMSAFVAFLTTMAVFAAIDSRRRISSRR